MFAVATPTTLDMFADGIPITSWVYPDGPASVYVRVIVVPNDIPL